MNEPATETLDKINAVRGMAYSDRMDSLLGLIESLHDRITDLENEKAEKE